MKRLFTWITLGALVVAAAASCQKNGEIEARLAEQDAKIKNLTSEVNNLKDAFNALKDAQVNGYFILNVQEIKEGDTVAGWKISVSNGETIILMNGKDGKDGENGKDGKPGKDGQDATGSSADVSVEETDSAWIITVGEESVTIPKAAEEVPFSIKFTETSYGAVAGSTVSYPFTISGTSSGDELSVVAVASEGYKAVVKSDNTAVDVTAPDPIVPGTVVVFAANGKGKADMKALTFTAAEVSVQEGYQTEPASADGADVTVKVTANVDYSVSIPVDWIHYNATKASATKDLVFTLDKNTGLARNAVVSLLVGGVKVMDIPISQAAGANYSISLGGNTAGITVTLSGDIAYAKVAIAATTDEALAAIDAGEGVTVECGSTSAPIVPTVTGENKVAFRVYNASDEEIDNGFFTRYTLSAADAALYCGTYEFTRLNALTINNRSAWVDLTSNNPAYVENGYSDAHIVVAPSPYIRESLLVVTDFLGFGADACGNKSITEEKLIPRNAGYSSFLNLSPVSAPEYALLANPVIKEDKTYICIDGTRELFLIGEEKFYLTRDNSQTTDQIYFQLEKTESGDVTLTDDSNYNTLVIVSASQSEAFADKYRGDTSTVYFRGGETFSNLKPVAVKKATE